MDDKLKVKNPDNWTTTELFTYLIIMSIISPDENFEDWKNNRTDIVKMVKQELNKL